MDNEPQVNLPDIIRNRKKLPSELKSIIISSIFFNCILFIIMMAITFIINFSFNKLDIPDFKKYINIIQVACCIISIIILEVSFRKDSGKIALYGIEFLVFSVYTLYIPYMYISKANIEFFKIFTIVFLVYYIIKSIVILVYLKHDYLRKNISDVKEIVKEEKKGYIDEESTKTLKEKKVEEEKRMKAREAKIRENKSSKANKKSLNSNIK